MGTSYHEQGSWNYVFGNFAQFLLALVVMAGLITTCMRVSLRWEPMCRNIGKECAGEK